MPIHSWEDNLSHRTLELALIGTLVLLLTVSRVTRPLGTGAPTNFCTLEHSFHVSARELDLPRVVKQCCLCHAARIVSSNALYYIYNV